MHFRQATYSDLVTLNRLIYQSEAYWGFDKAFMEKFMTFYQLTERLLDRNITWIVICQN